MDAEETKEISEMFKHHIGILAQSLHPKLDLVIEGQMMSDKIDRVDSRVECLAGKLNRLEAKVDAIAADLAAHRADTEARHGVYRVRESGE